MDEERKSIGLDQMEAAGVAGNSIQQEGPSMLSTVVPIQQSGDELLDGEF